MATAHSAGVLPWIVEGEKYALIGLSVKTEEPVPTGQLGHDLWLLDLSVFPFPDHWREWLGTIRMQELAMCDLLLLSKARSANPALLDDENDCLQQRVWHFYVGLMLSSRFAPAYRPVALTGACAAGQVDIRRQQDLDQLIPFIFGYPAVTPYEFRQAVHLGEALGTLAATPMEGGHWRLFRSLFVYVQARSAPELMDRIHEYCRCIEGLIAPDAGETKRQFRSRTELFIGAGHHQLIGEMFDIRSAVEHLHEDGYLEPFDRAKRLALVRFEAVAEYIARSAMARILSNRALWEHFANTNNLRAFWAQPDDIRRRIWGVPGALTDALSAIDPQYINDGQLGA